MSSERAIGPAVLVAEDPELGGLAREVVGDRLVVVRADAEQDDEPGPIDADDLAVDAHRRAPVVRWSRALTGGWAAG